jgi:glucosamine kinase
MIMPFKLLADSGSTKTDWRLIGAGGAITPFLTAGLNPYFVSSKEIADVIRHEIVPVNPELPALTELEVYFYGAGCGTPESKALVKEGLLQVFPKAIITVNTDILGAAHALCGKESGMVGILGTGMNSCLYDGKQIAHKQPSLGFILGDEGSGAYLGKRLISDYLNKELPQELGDRMEKRFGLTVAGILKSVYSEKEPNRYLASFSKFIYQNLGESYCSDLVTDAFRAFFDKHICKYPSWQSQTLSCTGSVAFWFSNLLRRVAEEKGVRLDRVVESPIAALTLYYLENDN